jgi:hypothetical protein
MKVKLFLFIIYIIFIFTTLCFSDVLIDPYINNYVLKNLSNEQILEYLNITDKNNNYSNIELGAKYIWRINPPFDRTLPSQIGTRWESLSQTDKNQAKIIWFKTYINSIDLNDFNKYINIENIIKKGKNEKEKFEKRKNLSAVDLTTDINIPVEEVSSTVSAPVVSPSPVEPTSTRQRPEKKRVTVPKPPRKTLTPAPATQTTRRRPTPPTPTSRRRPAAAQRQLPVTSESDTKPVKPDFINPEIKPRKNLGKSFPARRTAIDDNDKPIQTKQVQEEIDREEIEKRQQRVKAALRQQEILIEEKRKEDLRRQEEMEKEKMEIQLEQRRILLEKMAEENEIESDLNDEVSPIPEQNTDDLLRDRILELDVMMTRDQIYEKEERGLRREGFGPPTTLSN